MSGDLNIFDNSKHMSRKCRKSYRSSSCYTPCNPCNSYNSNSYGCGTSPYPGYCQYPYPVPGPTTPVFVTATAPAGGTAAGAPILYTAPAASSGVTYNAATGTFTVTSAGYYTITHNETTSAGGPYFIYINSVQQPAGTTITQFLPAGTTISVASPTGGTFTAASITISGTPFPSYPGYPGYPGYPYGCNNYCDPCRRC